MVMLYVLKMGGLGSGGLNFDAKNRRESTDLEDFFIAHIGGMDAYARGLKAAAKIIEDGELDNMVNERYSSFDSPLGQKLRDGGATLEEFEAYAKQVFICDIFILSLNGEQVGEPKKISGKQELC